ncbi:MAG: hypothetical protein J2O48_02515 [Solirubrobacterales bacterium]|nr:hypothetical protein [Solirubrobacterales bacterium]
MARVFTGPLLGRPEVSEAIASRDNQFDDGVGVAEAFVAFERLGENVRAVLGDALGVLPAGYATDVAGYG